MTTNCVIGISDIHGGCQLGLCPPWGYKLDEGGWYKPSPMQRKMWAWWEEMWAEWVPKVTRGDDYDLIVNGDSMDGEHHGTKSQITHNMASQMKCAYEIIAPMMDMCPGKTYIIRGSRAHDGTSGEHVEALAVQLGVEPNDDGQHARYELWKYIGRYLMHALDTVGTTLSSAYESTAVYKELVESYVEAGRWGDRPPDVVLRAHRHRYFKTEIATENDRAMAIVTPGWQGKTPFTHKLAGARQSQPQFGGVMIRVSEEDELYERHFVRRLERARPE